MVGSKNRLRILHHSTVALNATLHYSSAIIAFVLAASGLLLFVALSRGLATTFFVCVETSMLFPSRGLSGCVDAHYLVRY